MRYVLVISTSAYRDLEDAISYYENKMKGLGKRMEAEFWKSVEIIHQRPLSYRKRYKHYRQSMLSKFPYAIIYEIINERIIIYRVSHSKMQPAKRYKT